ncbi:serine/threonine protein kinase [Myceligenerans crystallogenes]|uniref:non-specific serine/threonine protein kinase n=1 Tax=Myceligenerans crystallogenes TaxID=316335 RepID=A0ABN2N301_9MICO
MSSKRAPSAPPHIDGYDFMRVIGSGGFADVFLYEQRRPRRQVAIKVLLKEWSSATQRETFDSEADLMATLGNHPSIVTMYEASAAGDGRPYLAMEYCSRPNLGARYRSERFSVAEAMRTTIQIAGAVETAHRLGILHRDIKPANILVTQFGHPVLTDFGIASTVDQAAAAEGMSIPWSPPESFQDPPVSGIATDVWGLAATCYTLLAGRTPFEVPGGSNRSADLMARIETAPLPPLGRTDVPPSLERVLATAMSKRATSRYPTALAFARALQQVQVEMSRDMTPIDILDESGHMHQEEEDEQDGTRFRNVVSIDPGQQPRGSSPAPGPAHGSFALQSPTVPEARPGYQPAAQPSPGFVPAAAQPSPGFVPAAGAPSSFDRPVATDLPYATDTVSAGAGIEETVARTSLPESQRGAQEYLAPGQAEHEEKPSPWRLVAPIAGAVALVAVIITVVVLQPWKGDEPADDPTAAISAPGVDQDVVTGYVPPPQQVKAAKQGEQVVVTWKKPEGFGKDDKFGYRVVSLEEAAVIYQPVDQKTTATVPAMPGQTCIDVVTQRGSNQSEPVRACHPAQGAGG